MIWIKLEFIYKQFDEKNCVYRNTSGEDLKLIHVLEI